MATSNIQTETVFTDAHFTAVNYILWLIGSGIILFFLLALLVIFIVHKKKSELKKRQQLLSRRRKGKQYIQPSMGIQQTRVEQMRTLVELEQSVS
ncbi:hypothetical protein LSH36_40g21000 [Paralvinella palmiformis]|uniref:Uncharacterized protein n=1 Tax=Paralvinella palmiformis TaxID=53620 RepID=A0AAD9K8F8_9ANNE|nr:hypothetical protein LSH36_40g21000 [Paralvinella palmiformis]